MKFGKTYDMTEIQNLTAMYSEMLNQLSETEVVLNKWKFIEEFMDLHKDEVPVEGRTYWHAQVRNLEKLLASISGSVEFRVGDLAAEMKSLKAQVARICGVDTEAPASITKAFKDAYSKYLASEKSSKSAETSTTTSK